MSAPKMPRKFWSAEEIERLRELYPKHRAAETARLLGRTMCAVYGTAQKLGIKGTPFRVTVIPGGEKFRFKKGLVPANKGLRRPGYSVGRGRMQETQFKKGVRSGIAAKNWRPIGTIMADADGYLHLKVRDAVHGKEHTGTGNLDVWPLYHRIVWEQHHGPIPPKHNVTFKDGDRSNCNIENLELISMAENARRNRMWNALPRELAEVIHLTGQLKRRIRRISGEEQNLGSQRPSV